MEDYCDECARTWAGDLGYMLSTGRWDDEYEVIVTFCSIACVGKYKERNPAARRPHIGA